MLRLLKRLLLGLAVLVFLIVAVGGIYLYRNPIPITDTRMLLNAALGSSIASPTTAAVAQRLQVPSGFSITLYARDVPMARMLKVTAAGDLIVSRPRAGEVILLERDRNGDGVPDGRRVLLSKLNRPHGIDVADGWLYVGENDAVGRVAFDEASGEVRGDYQRIVTGLTGDGNHWTKTVRIGPDGKLYVAQGSTCNVCEEHDKRRATIMRFNADGSGGEIHASGLRNSVGLDWSPWDHQLYATDNGRDLLGDDFPPCELNRIQQGGFYGWPYLNGFNVPDPDYGHGHEDLLKTALPPVFGFRPHNAPLGIHFLQANGLPEQYARTALVALHGSWNRSTPDGYKVVALRWRDDGSIEASDFVTGFEKDGNIIGRPVDVAQAADGSIYVSDDYAGAIYRIAYRGQGGDRVAAEPVDDASAGAGSEAAVQGAGDPLAGLTQEQREQLSMQGAKIYLRYPCANCHEQRFAGGMRRVKPLQNLSSRYSFEQLQTFFTAPTPPMPVFPLSDEERKALAAYLLTRTE